MCSSSHRQTVPLQASYQLDIASGASIVLLSAAVFAVTILAVSIREWLTTGRISLSSVTMTNAEREALLD